MPNFEPIQFTLFKDLTELSLAYNERVDDSWLEMLLSTCKNSLMMLSLRGCQRITSEGFVHLQHFTKLKSLDLHNTKLKSEDFLALLASLSEVVSLDLSYCELTMLDIDEEDSQEAEQFSNVFGYSEISSFQSLRALILDHTPISDAGVKFVLKFVPNIEFLSLFMCPNISKQFVKSLQAEHPKLTLKWCKTRV